MRDGSGKARLEVFVGLLFKLLAAGRAQIRFHLREDALLQIIVTLFAPQPGLVKGLALFPECFVPGIADAAESIYRHRRVSELPGEYREPVQMVGAGTVLALKRLIAAQYLRP